MLKNKYQNKIDGFSTLPEVKKAAYGVFFEPQNCIHHFAKTRIGGLFNTAQFIESIGDQAINAINFGGTLT